MRVDRKFRVFHNARYPYIDVRQPMEGLTELVEVADDEPFILHPGEFVLGQTLESIALPDDIVARLEGKSSLGRLGLLIHSTAGFVDPSLRGQPDARAVQRREPADHDLLRHADRPDLLHADGRPGRDARTGPTRRGSQVPGPGRAHAVPLLPELRIKGCSDRVGGTYGRPVPQRRYHWVSAQEAVNAEHRTARDRHHPDHRPDRLRAEAAARARPFDGQGIREFKNSLTSDKDDDDDDVRELERHARAGRGAARSRARSSTTAGRSRDAASAAALGSGMARIRPVSHEDRLTLVEHLDELRTRIIISRAPRSWSAFGAVLLAEPRDLRPAQRAAAGRTPSRSPSA